VLATELDMDKSVVSRQVRVLEEAGLVESLPDERDGRIRVLQPTATAVERVSAVRTSNQARVRAALENRSVDELRTFAEMLRVLAEA